MKSEIQIHDRADLYRIEIEGTIGVPEEWQFETPDSRVATYERFRETLGRIARIESPEVIVEIRSTGGDVNDALLIHDALRSLPGRITTRCYGYTASAATIIAQAASPGCREISANALYLIHNSICASEGNAAELAAKVELLRQTDARIAGLYAARSGRPVGEFEALMAENNGNGRWLSPEEAVGAGLADRMTDEAGGASALTRNLARGWERLLCGIGLRSGQPLPEERNILHPDSGQELRRKMAEAATEEARRKAFLTRVLPTEAPPTATPCRRPTPAPMPKTPAGCGNRATTGLRSGARQFKKP